MSSPRHHLVQFYEDDAFLIAEVGEFLGDSLDAGHSALVIATPEHRAALAVRLEERGAEKALRLSAGRYLALDAAETLALFMVDGWPDVERFAAVVRGAIERAKTGRRQSLCAFGEMVSLLWMEGRQEAALRLEELWNELARTETFSLLCAYPMQGFADAEQTGPFRWVCAAHSQVKPAESFVETASPAEVRRQVALLQQRSVALEVEVVRLRRAEWSLRQCERELAEAREKLRGAQPAEAATPGDL